MEQRARAAPPRALRDGIPWASAFAAAIALAVLSANASSYLPFLADDALISLRYARRLIDGLGLTWNDGPPLEGYSNLLWVLACAALGGLGLDLIDAARALGYTGAGAAIVAIAWTNPSRSGRHALPALVAGVGLALCGPLAVWTVGGLEQPLIAALLAWAVVRGYALLEPAATPKAWIVPGLLCGLLCWSRPDGALFTVGIGGGLIAALGPHEALRPTLRLALCSATAVAAQLVFRLAYYGDWVPNTARAKLGFTLHRVVEGLRYIAEGLWGLGGLLVPAIVLAILALREPAAARRIRFVVVPLVVWCAYVVVIGGDLFPGWRHLVPAVVLSALLLAEGVRVAVIRGGKPLTIVVATVPLFLVALAVMQHGDPQNRRARLERWEWDGQVVGELLREAFGDREPLLACDPGGCLPYFSGLPSIDMLGMNDRFLAENRPADFGRGPLGHELGNGDYVLGRAPDLVVFCLPRGSLEPCYRSGREMVADRRFERHYRPVLLEEDDPYTVRSRIWLRAEDGKLGIERRPGRIVVPGYLATAETETVARLDEQGRLVAVIKPNTSASFSRLRLDPGRWRMELDSEGPTLHVVLRASEDRSILAAEPTPLTFELNGETDSNVDISVRSPANGVEAHLREIVLERIDTVPGRVSDTP